MRRIVVISPHLDDAVFGCGDLLADNPGQTVMTVFAGGPEAAARRGSSEVTPWDKSAGFGVNDDILALRREEDRKALALVGAHAVWLPFWDSQYGRTPLVGDLVLAIEHQLRRLDAKDIYFPLGLFHSDHFLTHLACLRLFRQRRAAWFLYEDAMYRRYQGHEPAQRLERLATDGFAVKPVRSDRRPASEAKARAVLCYASQLRALGSTTGHPGFQDVFAPERYYRLKPPGQVGARAPATRLREPVSNLT